MRCGQALQMVTLVLLLLSCKKELPTDLVTLPGPAPQKKVLLKDIKIANLPSPYYHFEYNADSMVTKADFASGFNIYDVFYKEKKISEMRNNIMINHDTLRYLYDNAGRLAMIKFISEANVILEHVSFIYYGNLVKGIEWYHREEDGTFMIDRTLTFSYYHDGNVETIREYRSDSTGFPEFTSTRRFEQYDDKINVEDFSLIHDGIHNHFFILQGFRLQRNNPGKESFSGGVVPIAYTIDYSYSYNSNNTPSTKTGDVLFTAGPDAGKRFQTNAEYTYY